MTRKQITNFNFTICVLPSSTNLRRFQEPAPNLFLFCQPSFQSIGSSKILSLVRRMSSAGGRGAFIVFEGCDRSGKTTTCQRLVQFLNDQSKAAKFMRFPDRSTRIGATIGMALFATLIISTVPEN